MWLWLEETPSTAKDSDSFADSLAESWRHTIKSLQNIELMKYLLALMLFNDANSTLHAVYMVYGAQIGLPISSLMMGAVFNRVVGGVAALAWLGVAQLADARLCFMGCIVSTIVSIAVCAWMTTVTEFYIVVLTMTTSSSGTFIFAKVLLAMLTPKEKAAHNFGFMGMINRVAGFIGPFLFSTLSFLYDAKTGFIGSTSPPLLPATLPIPPSCSQLLLLLAIYIYTYIYIYTHTCLYTHKWIYLYTYIYIHVFMYTHIYIYIHTYICVYINIYSCIHIYTNLYIYTHIYMYAEMRRFILMGIKVLIIVRYMYTYIYITIHIYM